MKYQMKGSVYLPTPNYSEADKVYFEQPKGKSSFKKCKNFNKKITSFLRLFSPHLFL